jgi:hypothetical protein
MCWLWENQKAQHHLCRYSIDAVAPEQATGVGQEVSW